jgi:arylsulfatase B
MLAWLKKNPVKERPVAGRATRPRRNGKGGRFPGAKMGILLVGLAGGAMAAPTAPAARPNILVILADDLGYGDLGCMGSRVIRTPHIDALAAEGVLCAQAYVASAVCSPSRAGLLTGRDPRRFGYEGNLNQGAAHYATRPELLGLPPTEHTLADHLKAAGYATAAIGKWHLGVGAPFHPNARGFDYFCGFLGGGHRYFPQAGKHRIERNGQPVREFSSPYLTDFFTDEAERWIRARAAARPRRPWLLYLAYNAPHTPLQATEADLAACAAIPDPKRRTYAAMMRALDRGVGRVRALLAELGARERTLIVFFSDNGGATINRSWNGPLSGAKGCLREGGIRVPMIWTWPGRLPAGRRLAAPVSSLDLLPTFLAAAGARPLPLAPAPSYEDRRNRRRASRRWGDYDGVNLLPILTGRAAPPERTLFWRLQGQAAVRRGPDKLIRLSHRPAQLFRPATDVAEARDRAAADPATRDALFKLLAEWEATRATVPLWGSSPFWQGESARIYDTWRPGPEPGRPVSPP